MKRPYQIAGVIVLIFAVFMSRESLMLAFYTRMGPGPGFFPLIVSIVIGLLGVVMFYQATYQHSEPMPADFLPSKSSYLRIGAIVLAWIAVVGLMNVAGYRITMLAFLLFLLFALGRQNPVTAAVIALVASFGSYHLFNELLMIPLPAGVLGF